SELLATTAGSVLRGNDALEALVSRVREAFGLLGARLVAGNKTLVSDGVIDAGRPDTTITVGSRARLELYGPDIEAANRRLLAVIVTQIETVIEHSDLAETAREVLPLAATDRARSALLSALSHDLRRPLAAATAAVSGLRSAGDALTREDREELLSTA